MYDPHAICGTNNRTSMRKASSDTINVKILRMKIPRRYRGECEGEWKWATAERMSIIRVNRAAIGWTIKIADRVVLVSVGRSKVADCVSVNRFAVLYPISILLHLLP
jgi:hypothetical protein